MKKKLMVTILLSVFLVPIITSTQISGNNPADTMFIVIDTAVPYGTFDGSDDFVTGDYSAIPLALTTGTLSSGKYQFLIGPWEDDELGRTAVQYKIIRPASSTSDGYNKYRGVAPGCKIVSLKALDDEGIGSQSQFIDALDWIETNGGTYNISVVSMSLGFDQLVSAVDTAVNNLVSLGYVCVAAAGNAYIEGDPIYSPGTATKCITVGAIDDVDKIAIYSSNGLTNVKPDIVAPGGAYQAPIAADEDTHPIIAADSNDKDVVEFASGSQLTYWESEFNSNDYVAYQGTSMATPHVAGLVALIIQAMDSDWTHTEADVLKIKNILCGTATEVGDGETYDIYSNIPDLNRGTRDKIEGFGKVHGDAAIEAILTEYIAGTTVVESLSGLPTGVQAWARRVELSALTEFTAEISTAGTADYDLYLYDPTVDVASATGILDSSTQSGLGLVENISYTPASAMTAYLVVKRVSGDGSFTLDSATKTGTKPSSYPYKKITYNPNVEYSNLVLIDTNNNKIHDDLEATVKNGFASDYYTTIVTFDQPITEDIRSAIRACGGTIQNSWSIINGAAVQIKSSNLHLLSDIPEITFVTEDYKCRALLSTSVPQINVRPYVWDTLGYEGDPNDAIAIIDTGVDDTHPDLSGKIVHWEDFIGHSVSDSGDNYVTATDWNGHGTHVTSIAVGSGAAAGTASNIEVSGTLGLPVLSGGSGLVQHVDVESSGTVELVIQWDDKDSTSSPTTPTSSPTFFLGISTASWVAIGTIGLATIILIVRKRRK